MQNPARAIITTLKKYCRKKIKLPHLHSIKQYYSRDRSSYFELYEESFAVLSLRIKNKHDYIALSIANDNGDLYEDEIHIPLNNPTEWAWLEESLTYIITNSKKLGDLYDHTQHRFRKYFPPILNHP